MCYETIYQRTQCDIFDHTESSTLLLVLDHGNIFRPEVYEIIFWKIKRFTKLYGHDIL